MVETAKKIIKIPIIIIVIIIVATSQSSCFFINKAISTTEEKDEATENIENDSAGDTNQMKDKVINNGQPETVIKYYIDNAIPIRLWIIINQKFKKIFDGLDKFSYKMVFKRSDADIIFDVKKPAKNIQDIAGLYYYAPVVSFFSMIEDISFKELKDIWQGRKSIAKNILGDEVEVKLVARHIDIMTLRKFLGNESIKNLQIISTGEIMTEMTDDNETIAIIPFDVIEPGFKVLDLDGQSVLDKDLEYGQYALCGIAEISYRGSIDMDLKEKINSNFCSDIFTNRESDDMVSIIMTGVTALTRQEASIMDSNGILYPAEKISEILLDADITHISNEVSFVEDCYAARPNTMVFCSKPQYIELLDYLEIDVIELTGNHIKDYGTQWFEYTIDIYDSHGFKYFGGGRDLEDARKPATFSINGYKFAFIGANSFGPSHAWATGGSAGAAPINTLGDESKEKDMQIYEDLVKRLKSQDFNVIFTFQYAETYSYEPTPQQVIDFERISDAGAVVVSGSQSHQPQGIEIRNGKFINFGLGNLFFVQNYPDGHSLDLPVRQGLVVKHIFYRGSLINTVLITTLMDKGDWQPYPTEGQQRARLLESVFNASILDL